jgi:uncharacterized lipoprotein YbaY
MTGGTAENPSVDQIDASFAHALGIEGDGTEALAALRALPPEVLAGDLNLENLLKAALVGAPTSGTAMIEGSIVVAEPGVIIKRGDVPNVPIIIGTTALDLPLYFPPSKIDPFSYFGADADAARAAYNAPATLDQNSLTQVLLSIGADMTMHEPARFVARQMTAHGNAAWLYRFTYTAETTRPAAIGQTHAGELPFLFDHLAAKYGDQVTDQDRQVAHTFNVYVGNFVKTGDPNGEGLPAWPQFDPAHFDLMNFTLDDGAVFGPEPRPSVALVERAADAQETATMTTTSATGVYQPSGVLTGTVTYRQRMALPPGSVVEVQLQDVSKADAVAEVIASQTITTTGENVPIPFTLTYDPAQIDPRYTYALSVHVTVDGQLRWRNAERYVVLTRGAPMTGAEVVVQPAQ